MNTKTAMITIAGRPNVGKSTLANALVGEKIAIVSHKPQTTRNRICAIVDRGDTQLVFIDTPGFHRPRTKLGDYMVNVVNQSVADVDAVILLVEPIANVGPQEQELIEKIREAKVPAILVINKIDTVEKETLLPVIAAYKDLLDFTDVIPISAKWHDGLDSDAGLRGLCTAGAVHVPGGHFDRYARKAGHGRDHPRKAAVEPRKGNSARHGGRDYKILRARRRHH